MGRAVHLLFLEYETMKTITLGRARYTVRDDRDILGELLKFTGKHKIIKSKGAERRMYPTEGATLSTAAYVKQYYGLNSERRLFKNLAAPFGDANLVGFYDSLSDRLSVPMGEDSMEVEL
jgi:hypothetical protein